MRALDRSPNLEDAKKELKGKKKCSTFILFNVVRHAARRGEPEPLIKDLRSILSL